MRPGVFLLAESPMGKSCGSGSILAIARGPARWRRGNIKGPEFGVGIGDDWRGVVIVDVVD